MPDQPSVELIQLLDQLDLASRGDILAVGRRARRLARGLPVFDSVWVDALAQAGVLTPLQATQIKAGRGHHLRVGEYILQTTLDAPPYAQLFRARHLSSGTKVQLLLADIPPGDASQASKELQTLIDVSGRLEHPVLLTIRAGGLEASGSTARLWCVCDDLDGITAQRWLVPHGRMPHQAVLHVAQQMTSALAELERYELPHADISPTSLLFNEEGDVRLLMPGIRGLLRPEEGYGHAELAPEAYDYVAPERIVRGTPADTASELYACGALWWHLLAGRPPVPGGDSVAKLRNLQKGRIPAIDQVAPETAAFFAEAVTRCTDLDPQRRGGSFDHLAAQLGPPTREGAGEIASCVARHIHPPTWAETGSLPTENIRWVSGLFWGSVASFLLLGVLWYLRVPSAAPTAHVPPPLPEKSAVAPTGSTVPQQATDSQKSPPGLPRPQLLEPNIILLTQAAAAEGRLPKLSAGITVRGDPQQRPLFRVPPHGILLDLPHVRFENIDFVWQHGDSTTPSSPPAMIRLSSRWVEFHRCSFQSGPLPFGSPQPIAIACSRRERSREDLNLPAAVHTVLDLCVLREVAAGIAVPGSTSLTVQSHGTLYLGPGPLVQLAGWPWLEQPIRLALSHCTLRNSTALVAVRGGEAVSRPGAISVHAEHCVFAPRADGALLFCQTRQPWQDLMQRVQWTGHSSLLAADAAIVSGDSEDGEAERLDESRMAIEGLARGEVQFASPQLHRPAASRLQAWSVPLRSSTPPGIDHDQLRLPSVDDG
ncbi:MAG: protein kinase [Planctomycetales bacterium]|nr:protein kinase [Planctomycetales bacterium]NIM10034.1 protein kinase [Planctomycetales bacterium]NIN09475.1 protein kinase [Planctomycetales bacterium]NIN78583.1 protein kinase [Planctomycetales bacterium]NIO35777.1 protein kinase [Planctomycetales bacterium]